MNFRVGNSAFTHPTALRGSAHVVTGAFDEVVRPVEEGATGGPWEHLDVHVIHPVAAEVDVDVLYGLRRGPVDGRPWVGLCMIASLDGSTVVDGRSGALGNATDASVLGALRRAAGAVLVGAATVRAESYGPPGRRDLRIGVVTGRGDIDADSDLFTSGAGFLVMPDDGPAAPIGSAGPVDVVRAGSGSVDLDLALRRLDQVMDPPTFVQVEGGSHLNGAMLASGCVDELDVTLSPVLVGGDGPRLTSGAPAMFERFELAHLATEDGYLYGRWTRRTA